MILKDLSHSAVFHSHQTSTDSFFVDTTQKEEEKPYNSEEPYAGSIYPDTCLSSNYPPNQTDPPPPHPARNTQNN